MVPTAMQSPRSFRGAQVTALPKTPLPLARPQEPGSSPWLGRTSVFKTSLKNKARLSNSTSPCTAPAAEREPFRGVNTRELAPGYTQGRGAGGRQGRGAACLRCSAHLEGRGSSRRQRVDVIEGEISVLQKEAAPHSWELAQRWMERSKPHTMGKPQGPVVLWGPAPAPATPAREKLNPPRPSSGEHGATAVSLCL